jgi:hypothetical protein
VGPKALNIEIEMRAAWTVSDWGRFARRHYGPDATVVARVRPDPEPVTEEAAEDLCVNLSGISPQFAARLSAEDLNDIAAGEIPRRPDVVLFVNGLPLALIELKNAADENATIWTAFQQLQTYKAEVPSLFAFNDLLVVSDGVEARVGTFTAGREWFKPWRTVSSERLADLDLPELQVVLEGLFEKRRLLDLIRDFIVFENDGSGAPGQEDGGLRLWLDPGRRHVASALWQPPDGPPALDPVVGGWIAWTTKGGNTTSAAEASATTARVRRASRATSGTEGPPPAHQHTGTLGGLRCEHSAHGRGRARAGATRPPRAQLA